MGTLNLTEIGKVEVVLDDVDLPLPADDIFLNRRSV